MMAGRSVSRIAQPAWRDVWCSLPGLDAPPSQRGRAPRGGGACRLDGDVAVGALAGGQLSWASLEVGYLLGAAIGVSSGRSPQPDDVNSEADEGFGAILWPLGCSSPRSDSH